MTFATDVMKAGRGKAVFFNFSYDDFSTVTYRLSDIEGKLDGTNWYTPRVVRVGAFRRGLGQNRIAASGGVEVVLANHDGAYDALCDRANMDDIAKLRVRAYLSVYDVDDPSTGSTQQLGEYVLDRWPRRNDDTITLTLADDILGPLSQGVVLPRFLDWSSVGASSSNPLYNGAGFPDAYNVYSPVQLAFGEDWVRAFPHLIPRSPHSNYAGQIIVPICCTDDTVTAAADSEVSAVRVQFWSDEAKPDGAFVTVPYDYTHPISGNRIWTVQRSPTITTDSKSFVVIYLRVDVRSFLGWLARDRPDLVDRRYVADTSGNATGQVLDTWYGSIGGYSLDVINNAGGSTDSAWYYKQAAARVSAWYVKGKPLSARTQTTLAEQHACDVLKDLIEHYTKQTIACDETSRTKVKAMRASSRASGVVQPWTGDKEGGRKSVITSSVRSVLTQLCQSSDIDIFINWSGDVGFSTDGYSFELAAALDAGSLVSLEEERLIAFEDWMPSNGERGAPFNRLYMEGGRASPADGLPVPFQGPWDFDSSHNCGIAQASRIIEATLQQGWRPIGQIQTAPWWWRVIEVQARQRVRLRTFLDGLRLDLGDYFLLTWSRNLGGPYSSTLFQVDAIAYSPDDDTVEIEAAWRDSLQTDRGYLLDSQTLVTRVTATFGRTATVDDSSSTVDFSSGNLVTDGVVAGDMLVLKDSTQAADVFTRFRALRIVSVLGATSLDVSDPSLDFGTGGTPTAVADWTILRGATTYPTAVSDPTNYPSGSSMYGKVTNSSGTYSDASTGNRLLDG